MAADLSGGGAAPPPYVGAAPQFPHLPSATGFPVTTSQGIDKSPPRLRWPRRRAAPTPGVDDARALAAANLRILQLEMSNATLLRRADRLAGQCAPPCWHAERLAAAELEILQLQVQHGDVYHHVLGVLDKVRATNAGHPARDEPDGSGERP
jgi:hypothetical protein